MEFKEPFPPAGADGVPQDPRLQPTPDYGTLGPGSDVAGCAPNPAAPAARKSQLPLAHLVAAVIGMSAALIVGMTTKAHPARPGLPASVHNEPASAKDMRQIDDMKPQKQAEVLLELAVSHTAGAVEQISSRADRWNGKVEWDSQIASLTNAALNSNDMKVRESGIEVELAAYGLSKNSASLDYLLRTAESPDHSQKIWALWGLGLMANRGVEPGQIVEVLTRHLDDSDMDSRRWAVEGMALAGTDQVIQPLLTTMRNDPSPIVRERAACSLAESGMFTQEQRMTVVPQLIAFTEDPSIDPQTRQWAFQALGDIAHQRLPNEPGAWRRWYQEQR